MHCVCVCARVHGRHRQTDRHLSSRRWAGVSQPTRQEIMDGFSASSEIGPAMILARRWALLEQPPASLRCSPSLISLFISLSHPYTPRLRLSWSLRTVLPTDTNIFYNFFCSCVCMCAHLCVCVFPLRAPSPAWAANGFHKHLSGRTSHLSQSEK